MKINRNLPVLIIFAVLISSDASADQTRNGLVKNGVYHSPDKSFQLDIPKLVPPGDFIQDVRESETAFKVVMGDELCRRIFVVQHAKESYGDFGGFTQDRLTRMGIEDLDYKELSEPHAGAIFIKGRIPKVSTCTAMTFGAGGQLVAAETSGSNAGVIFLESEDAYYEVGYLVDVDGMFASSYGGTDIDDVLGDLMTGFKLIGPRSAASLPPVAPLIRFISDADSDRCKFIGPIKGKSSSFSAMATVSEHMSKAKAKLRQEAEKKGANAIIIHESNMKNSALTGHPYMQAKADAFACDSVPAYMAWEIRAAK